MSQVPAATRTLRVLRFLASQPDPVPLDRIVRACDLPRSTAYHLLTAMVDEGFVVHLADEHRYGLGVAAFEVGSGYVRQEPLQRIARRPLADLVDRTGQSAHLAVLHGRDVLYVARGARPGSAAAGHRRRRPAAGPPHRQRPGDPGRAAGRQVRALYPDAAAFVDRHGLGPRTPQRAAHPARRDPAARLRRPRTARSRPGLASVAVAVLDHNGHPVAGIAVTYAAATGRPARAARRGAGGEVRRTADALTRRIGGAPRASG